MADLEQNILTVLRASPALLTSRDLVRAIGNVTKKQVNQVLYRLKSNNVTTCTSTTPPQWSMVNSSGSEQKSQTSESLHHPDVPIVLVDLGNVHDTLKPLEPYVRAGEVKAYAYADLAFNGYGVSPKCDDSIPVFQSHVPDKNAADTEMIWKCAEIALLENSDGHALQFYIATKDQGFRTLEAILKRHGHSVTFVRGWDDLQMEIS